MQQTRKWLVAFAIVGFGTGAAAISGFDFGLFRDQQLDAHSLQTFGIVTPVEASSTASISAATAAADPTSLVTLAKGLSARVVTARANVGPNIDMMALWPDDQHPTHLIACNEEGWRNPDSSESGCPMAWRRRFSPAQALATRYAAPPGAR